MGSHGTYIFLNLCFIWGDWVSETLHVTTKSRVKEKWKIKTDKLQEFFLLFFWGDGGKQIICWLIPLKLRTQTFLGLAQLSFIFVIYYL